MVLSASPQAGTQNPDEERLIVDYQWTNEQIKLLTDIRFRLLLWVPPLVTLAIPLILGSASSAPPNPVSILALGLLGLFVTLGIVVYDLRNSMLYDANIHRASLIEQELKIKTLATPDGLYGRVHALRARSDNDFTFFKLKVNHGTALGVVYAAMLSSWIFAIAKGGLLVILAWVKFYFPTAPCLGCVFLSGNGNTSALLGLLIAVFAFYCLKRRLVTIDTQERGRAERVTYHKANQAHERLRTESTK